MKTPIWHGNRGMGLEHLVEISNVQYRHQGLAVVEKVPTEWKPIRNGHGQVVSAKVDRKAVCDFLGVMGKGRAVAFDCKENRNETSFPFDQRWAHEVEFLRAMHKCGAATFLLIEHVPDRTVYLLPGPDLFHWWDEAYKHNGRRSIRIETLRRYPPVPQNTMIPLDYLAVIRQYWPQLWEVPRAEAMEVKSCESIS